MSPNAQEAVLIQSTIAPQGERRTIHVINRNGKNQGERMQMILRPAPTLPQSRAHTSVTVCARYVQKPSLAQYFDVQFLTEPNYMGNMEATLPAA